MRGVYCGKIRRKTNTPIYFFFKRNLPAYQCEKTRRKTVQFLFEIWGKRCEKKRKFWGKTPPSFLILSLPPPSSLSYPWNVLLSPLVENISSKSGKSNIHMTPLDHMYPLNLLLFSRGSIMARSYNKVKGG